MHSIPGDSFVRSGFRRTGRNPPWKPGKLVRGSSKLRENQNLQWKLAAEIVGDTEKTGVILRSFVSPRAQPSTPFQE